MPVLLETAVFPTRVTDNAFFGTPEETLTAVTDGAAVDVDKTDVGLSRKKSKEELSLTEVMSQKGFTETTAQNKKPEFENIIIGSVKHPEALLSDNDIAIIYDRDIKIVLEQLSNCDPDTMKEKAVTSLGLKVSRLKERLQFAQEHLDKAKILITKDNLKPLSLRLHTQKSVSNQDKYLFKKFLESLPS